MFSFSLIVVILRQKEKQIQHSLCYLLYSCMLSNIAMNIYIYTIVRYRALLGTSYISYLWRYEYSAH